MLVGVLYIICCTVGHRRLQLLEGIQGILRHIVTVSPMLPALKEVLIWCLYPIPQFGLGDSWILLCISCLRQSELPESVCPLYNLTFVLVFLFPFLWELRFLGQVCHVMWYIASLGGYVWSLSGSTNTSEVLSPPPVAMRPWAQMLTLDCSDWMVWVIVSVLDCALWIRSVSFT